MKKRGTFLLLGIMLFVVAAAFRRPSSLFTPTTRAAVAVENARLFIRHGSSRIVAKLFGTNTQTRRRHACINHLLQLESAKERWALDSPNQTLQPGNIAEVLEYIKGGMPTCEGGGRYSINSLGTSPTCSLAKFNPGHRLPGGVLSAKAPAAGD